MTKNQKKSRLTSGPHPVDKLAGTQLRTRRRLVGLSQGQLGKAIGVSFQQVQKYENGANRMSASCLEQLAEVLDVPVSYFFGEVPQPSSSRRVAGFRDNKQANLEDTPGNDNAFLQSREALELIRAYRRIKDPKKRRKVYELIKSMASDKDKG